jgi:RNA polymerase sigma-70 factor (ECF subfamily)
MDDLTAALAVDLDRAFPHLVEAHVDRLYTIALRVVGSEPDAQELASDALVRAYRAMAGYDAERIRSLDLRPWLTTIVLNAARNRRRRRPPDLSLEIAEHAMAREARSARARSGEDEPDPEAAVLGRERAERLARALAALPLRYRAPVVLRHIDDCTYAEMAGILGRPEGTLKAQVHRGLALLRAALEAAETRAPSIEHGDREEERA